MESYANLGVVMLLVAIAAVTYLTRSGGYLILARFSRIPPRVGAALEAVPAAVITAIAIPPAISGGAAEFLAMAVAAIASLRLASFTVLLLGLGTLVLARGLGL